MCDRCGNPACDGGETVTVPVRADVVLRYLNDQRVAGVPSVELLVASRAIGAELGLHPIIAGAGIAMLLSPEHAGWVESHLVLTPAGIAALAHLDSPDGEAMSAWIDREDERMRREGTA